MPRRNCMIGRQLGPDTRYVVSLHDRQAGRRLWIQQAVALTSWLYRSGSLLRSAGLVGPGLSSQTLQASVATETQIE